MGVAPDQIAAAKAELDELKAKLEAIHAASVSPGVRPDFLANDEAIEAKRAELAELQARQKAANDSPKTAAEQDSARKAELDAQIAANEAEQSRLRGARFRIAKEAARTGNGVTAGTTDDQTGLTFDQIKQKEAAAARRIESASVDREAVRPRDDSPVDKVTGKSVRQSLDELAAAEAANPLSGFSGPAFDQEKLFGTAFSNQASGGGRKSNPFESVIDSFAGSAGTFSGVAGAQLRIVFAGESSRGDRRENERPRQPDSGEYWCNRREDRRRDHGGRIDV